MAITKTRPAAGAFNELLAAVNAVGWEQRQPLVDAFVAAQQQLPYTEGDQVTFMLRYAWARQVSLVGDITCWTRSIEPMQHVAGTTLWYLNRTLPTDARVDYKYIVDGNWILDPSNPRRSTSGYGENSELAMPAWQPSAAAEYQSAVPHGQLLEHNGFYSPTLGNTRDLRVYLPPGFDPTRRYPSFYIHDGLEYLSLAAATNVLDNLIAARRIEPLVVVFVPPVDRFGEYGGRSLNNFGRFMTTELLPFIDMHYATGTTDAARRGTMGASMGGFIAMRLGADYPQLFGRLAGQSSALWAAGGQLLEQYRKGRTEARRIYMSSGNICDNVRINDTFSETLRARGYDFEYHVYNEGHSWGLWRKDMERLLTYLWQPTH